jgi:sulfur relay (sulfurtransferase) DsrF/TusC family protein
LVFGSASATFGLATALATGFAFASNVAAGCAEDVVTTALLGGASSSLLLSDVVKCMDLLRVARKTLDLDGSDSCE